LSFVLCHDNATDDVFADSAVDDDAGMYVDVAADGAVVAAAALTDTSSMVLSRMQEFIRVRGDPPIGTFANAGTGHLAKGRGRGDGGGGSGRGSGSGSRGSGPYV
jgi:hypothetical protein